MVLSMHLDAYVQRILQIRLSFTYILKTVFDIMFHTDGINFKIMLWLFCVIISVYIFSMIFLFFQRSTIFVIV